MNGSKIATAAALLLLSYALPSAASESHRGHDRTMSGDMRADGPNDPHMRLTPRRKAAADDARKAREIARETRKAIARYKDIKVARRDGYRPFGDGPDATIVHYVNVPRSVAENWRLDPSKPGALLYDKSGGGYCLIGAMFVAPDKASLDVLNARVPLSQARWHLHTNICTPRPIWSKAKWGRRTADGRPLYGPGSPISTREDCRAVGGKFNPTIFGWMVHVYPFRDDPAMWWHEDHGH